MTQTIPQIMFGSNAHEAGCGPSKSLDRVHFLCEL
jgi:hypothetical protein